MQGPNMGLGPALSPLLLFYLSFLSLIFVTVESGFFSRKKLSYFNAHAQTAWILASLSCACLCNLKKIKTKNQKQTTLNFYNIYTYKHMYKCVYIHMVLLQSKQWGRPYGSFSCSFYLILCINEGWDSAFPAQSSVCWALHLIPLQAQKDTSGD